MDLLAESAVRITVLAAGVAFVLRVLRIRSPRLAQRTWMVVAAVMLLLPGFVAWGPELAVPVLPAHGASDILPRDGNAPTTAEPNGSAMTTAAPAGGSSSQMTWRAAGLAVYVAGVGLFLARLVIGLRRARAIRRTAVHANGHLTHPACVTPMTVGIIAPVVILPPDWVNWTEDELSAVLAHEQEHVRRHDPLAAGVALLNRAIFWFHPLAWWLQRTIGRLSEQACDAEVIARGHDCDVYSACLLRFARLAARAGSRITPMATAMPGTGLRERLGMLARQLPAPPSRPRLACAAVAGTALGVVCAAAVPAAAPAQNAPLQARNQVVGPIETSEHFEIVYDQRSASRMSDVVRELEAAYADVSMALQYDMPRRVRIVLVQRDRDIAPLPGGLFPPRGASTSDLYVVISLESLDRGTGHAVHELTHQFAFDIVPETSRIAPVLIEGLAEHQRGAWATEDLRLIRVAAAAGAIPPVGVLVDTDRHWAHAVFDFVAAREGADGVRRLLFALRAHGTLAPAVPMAFGVTLDQFEQEFRTYVTATFG